MRRPSASARLALGARSAASTLRRQPCILMDVHSVLRGITAASQRQLPASRPSGQPIESSQLGGIQGRAFDRKPCRTRSGDALKRADTCTAEVAGSNPLSSITKSAQIHVISCAAGYHDISVACLSRHLPRPPTSVFGRFSAKSPVGRAGGSSARLPNAHAPASRRSCDNILHVSSGYTISGPASHYLTFQAVPGCGCRPLPQASSGTRFVPESAERTQAREPRPRSSCPRA